MAKKEENKIINKNKDKENKEIKDAEIILDEKNQEDTELKDNEKVIEKSKAKSKNDKALFLQRLVAFCLDFLVIVCVSSLFSSPFVDVSKSNELNRQSNEIRQKYIDKEISTQTYLTEAMDVTYKLARNNGILSIVTIIVGILYFVVFQIYNSGQTLGKKLMKIKVVSEDGELTMNQMIFRALLANSLLVDVISFAFLTFGTKQVYFYCSATFGLMQYIIILVSALMVMYRKDGCAIHDRLVHTMVIRV